MGVMMRDTSKETDAMMSVMQGNKVHDVCHMETGRQIHSLQRAWLAHLWIKACQTTQRLREYYSVCANTMNLPGLEGSQHRKREKERERNIDVWLPVAHPLLGT